LYIYLKGQLQMLFVSKQKKVEVSLDEYCQKVSECVQYYEKAIKDYVQTSDRSHLSQNYTEVDRLESAADDKRRQLEVMMYSKSLFPESRGDILGLLETMDKVPNQSETAIGMLYNQHVYIPPEFGDDLVKLADLCRRCVEAMLESVSKLFVNFTSATLIVGKVNELESEADDIEQSIIERAFANNMDGFAKIMLRDLVKQVASVSDRAENVADRISIIVAKRNI
jgi:predicted phosphate transport protein (TIGR00153 family)